MHPENDHLYIPLTSSHKSTFSLGITTFFLLSSVLLRGSRFLKKSINLLSLKSLYLFQSRQNMVSKYGHLMPPGVFPDKVTPVIHFTDETVVLCDVLDVKILLQVLVIYK